MRRDSDGRFSRGREEPHDIASEHVKLYLKCTLEQFLNIPPLQADDRFSPTPRVKLIP